MLKQHQLLTPRELAEQLRVAPNTIRRWTSLGKIPAVRLSRKVVRYRLTAVLRALVSQEVKRG
jgi:excisionase family DNA binding protein